MFSRGSKCFVLANWSMLLREAVLDDKRFRCLDVGGQRSERSKWLHCFEDVGAIMFFVAISEYDHVVEDPTYRQPFEEALTLFKKLLASPWFKNTFFIVILNKKDLFAEKIMHSHMKDYFPEYDGPQQDNFEAREFIFKMFYDLNEEYEQCMASWFTRAIETENIQFIFDAVKDNLFRPPNFML